MSKSEQFPPIQPINPDVFDADIAGVNENLVGARSKVTPEQMAKINSSARELPFAERDAYIQKSIAEQQALNERRVKIDMGLDQGPKMPPPKEIKERRDKDVAEAEDLSAKLKVSIAQSEEKKKSGAIPPKPKGITDPDALADIKASFGPKKDSADAVEASPKNEQEKVWKDDDLSPEKKREMIDVAKRAKELLPASGIVKNLERELRKDKEFAEQCQQLLDSFDGFSPNLQNELLSNNSGDYFQDSKDSGSVRASIYVALKRAKRGFVERVRDSIPF